MNELSLHYLLVWEYCVTCASPLWRRLTQSFLQIGFLEIELEQISSKHSNVFCRKSWKLLKGSDAISFKIPEIKCRTTAATPEEAKEHIYNFITWNCMSNFHIDLLAKENSNYFQHFRVTIYTILFC